MGPTTSSSTEGCWRTNTARGTLSCSAMTWTRGAGIPPTHSSPAPYARSTACEWGGGPPAAAAAVVAQVSSTFRYETDYSSSAGQNEIWNLNTSIKRYTVADTEANVGLPFVSANDPRVPRVSGGSVFDSGFPITSNRQGIWGQYSPVAIATGIEARLIEAEADLQAGAATTWLNDLNVLRTNTALYPPIQSGFTRGPT